MSQMIKNLANTVSVILLRNCLVDLLSFLRLRGGRERRKRLIRRRGRKRRKGNLVSFLFLNWQGLAVSASLLMNHLISRVGGGRDGRGT